MSKIKNFQLPKRAKLIIEILASVILIGAFIFVFLQYKDSKTEFSSSSKNGISMGTIITAKSYGDGAAQHNNQMLSIISQLENQISRRVEGSAVSRINNGEAVDLSDIANLVSLCKTVSEDTGGSFDLTVGAVSSLWDFGGDNERLPDKKEIDAAVKTVDFKKINVNKNTVSISGGGELDLGAIGKGYACDLCKAYLSGTSCEGAVLSVGGSIMTFGKRNKSGDKWRVAVKHPRKDNAILGTISMKDGFVSTSGDYEKYFEKDGKTYHHILDAKTGYPAQSDLISVTIVADSGVLSDALSTACFILGFEKGKALAEKYNVGAVFVDSDEKVTVIGGVDFASNEN